MTKAFYVTTGELYDYHTGDYLRPATPAEARASREAAETDGGAGAIDESDLSQPGATCQYVGVSNGKIVQDYGEHEAGSTEAGELVRLETGRLQARHGSGAVVACVDDDRLLDVGDAVEVDDDGVATLVDE